MGPRALLNLPPRVLLLGLLIPTCWFLSLQLWHVLLLANMLFGIGAVFVGLLISGAVLTLSSYAPRRIWLLLWLAGEPWLLGGVPPLLGAVMPLPVLSVLVVWSLLAFWGYFGWWPVMGDDDQVGLHKARWASRREVGGLLAGAPPADGLLLGKSGGWIAVRPQPQRRELGNLLIVGPTRSGKGLLATGQLLTWRHSVVVNDIKGELFGATAGHRSQLGRVYVIDPSGIGHQYDPFASRRGEDSLYSAATSLLSSPDEADGLIFTQRATLMLTQLLLAAQRIGTPCLPYVREMVRLGLREAADRLQAIDPQLATQLLDRPLVEADFNNRFLLSAWGTLSARLRPLLTESAVRCFASLDFSAQQLLSGAPVTVYLRWNERDLLALSPLVRLLWDSLIGELISTYDAVSGIGCQPVLLLVDEAGRTAIPSLAEHATTVVGRGLNLWMAVQSLSQLEAVYGSARAQVLRDNMESQIYYRPTDLATASYLERRLGQVSEFARSVSLKAGEETGAGKSEQAVSLQTAQEILQLRDEEIIAFHRRLPPMILERVDWRKDPSLARQRAVAPPILSALPNVAHYGATPTRSATSAAVGYIDPDRF